MTECSHDYDPQSAAIVAGRAKWRPLGIPLASKIENQK